MVLLELRIQAVVVAVLDITEVHYLAVLAAVVLLLLDTLIRLHLQRQPQAHPQLRLLVATVFTNGLDQGVSHSDGTLCTT
jgi:hypothetical protein